MGHLIESNPSTAVDCEPCKGYYYQRNFPCMKCCGVLAQVAQWSGNDWCWCTDWLVGEERWEKDFDYCGHRDINICKECCEEAGRELGSFNKNAEKLCKCKEPMTTLKIETTRALDTTNVDASPTQ